MLNNGERSPRERSVIQRAFQEESVLHASMATELPSDQPDETILDTLLEEHAAVLFAATIGAGKRLVLEDPSGASEEALRYRTMADDTEAQIPPRLRALWRRHYVEGLPLAACTAATGVDLASTEKDYCELARMLRTIAYAPRPARALEVAP